MTLLIPLTMLAAGISYAYIFVLASLRLRRPETLSADELRAWLGVVKFLIGTIALGAVTLAINSSLENQRIQIAQASADSRIKIEQLAALDKYIDRVSGENLKGALDLARFFKHIIATPEWRQLWQNYFDELTVEYEKKLTRQTELQTQVAQSLKSGGKPADLDQQIAELEALQRDLAPASAASVRRTVRPKRDLSNANLEGMDLSSTYLLDANMKNAKLRGANLRLSDGWGANLTDADLRGANLSLSDFNGANFTRAKLASADLTDADLQDATLTDADLTNANLSGTVLTRVKGLTANQIARACADPKQPPDLDRGMPVPPPCK